MPLERILKKGNIQDGRATFMLQFAPAKGKCDWNKQLCKNFEQIFKQHLILRFTLQTQSVLLRKIVLLTTPLLQWGLVLVDNKGPS